MSLRAERSHLFIKRKRDKIVRTANIKRDTSETQIACKLNLDGTGASRLDTPLAFLNHMLTLFAKHGFLDLELEAKGDIEIDFHHLVEDMGIVLGQALTQAVGSKRGIRRYGNATIPMDESLATVTMDICSRPCLILNGTLPNGMVGDFAPELLEEFFRAFCNHSGATLHIQMHYGQNLHHLIESVFKAFGRALNEATRLDGRIGNTVLSTKGML